MYHSYIIICMKTTVILKQELLEKAQRLSQLKTKTDVIHAGLQALIEQYSRQRLAALGGYDPVARVSKRRRSE
jgi:Arc/MetJ family transcription regulator